MKVPTGCLRAKGSILLAYFGVVIQSIGLKILLINPLEVKFVMKENVFEI